jgi:hypothetical protein
VQHCLQGCHISPAALEALFLTLKFLDAEQNLEAYTTRAWVSMSLVPVSSHVYPSFTCFAECPGPTVTFCVVLFPFGTRLCRFAISLASINLLRPNLYHRRRQCPNGCR